MTLQDLASLVGTTDARIGEMEEMAAKAKEGAYCTFLVSVVVMDADLAGWTVLCFSFFFFGFGGCHAFEGGLMSWMLREKMRKNCLSH